MLFSNLLHLLSSILYFTGKVSKSNQRPLGPNLSLLSPNLTSSSAGTPAGPPRTLDAGSLLALFFPCLCGSPTRRDFYFSEHVTALLHLQTTTSWPDSGQNKSDRGKLPDLSTEILAQTTKSGFSFHSSFTPGWQQGQPAWGLLPPAPPTPHPCPLCRPPLGSNPHHSGKESSQFNPKRPSKKGSRGGRERV